MTSDRITFGRSLRTVRAGGAVLTETLHEAETRLSRHEHANANVNFVLHGSFGEQVEGRDHCCAAGSVLVKPAGASHANHYGPGRAHSLIVEFCPAPDSMLDDPLRRLDLWHSEDTTVAGIGWRLYREMVESDGATPLSIAETLAKLVYLIVAGRELDDLSGSQPAWLRRVRERLDEDAEAGLEALVSEAGVHPHHLLRAFRHYVGCTIGEYARRRRIRRAQRLLAESKMGVAAVAVDAGFCDQSHFTRVFKRCTGTTPGAYRRLTSGFQCDEDERRRGQKQDADDGGKEEPANHGIGTIVRSSSTVCTWHSSATTRTSDRETD